MTKYEYVFVVRTFLENDEFGNRLGFIEFKPQGCHWSMNLKMSTSLILYENIKKFH